MLKFHVALYNTQLFNQHQHLTLYQYIHLEAKQ